MAGWRASLVTRNLVQVGPKGERSLRRKTALYLTIVGWPDASKKYIQREFGASGHFDILLLTEVKVDKVAGSTTVNQCFEGL